ncbi:MAG: amidohydrolase family protein [Promethearchaeota archaeon]
MIEEYIKRFLPASWHDMSAKYKGPKGPKFDAHTHLHVSEDSDISKVLKIAEEYNIKKILGIVDDDVRAIIQKSHPDMFVLARFLRSQKLFKGGSAALASMVDEIYSQGYSMVKFWFAPRWKDYVKENFGILNSNTKLSDPGLSPIFERVQDLGLKFLIHISDPDIWYEQKYKPASYYGTKAEHLADLEAVISKYPKIQFQIAHFGAQPEPERLLNLGRWFDTYPNLYVDMSSARWIGRELSRNPQISSEFFQKYEDRIFYGTDLSFGWTREGTPEEYFLTRYLTFQTLLETTSRNIPLPFPDPENDNKTILNGLDLPLETLKKIYWENAAKFHGIS